MSDDLEIFSWNPVRTRLTGRAGRLRRRVPLGRRIDNFGDLLGPLIVEAIARQRGLDLDRPTRTGRLFSVGSVLRLAGDGDVVWGTGVNGKSFTGEVSFGSLDVRAVRGPLTAEFLRSRGIPHPEVFGDPGLLLPVVLPAPRPARQAGGDLTIVPNFHDYPELAGQPNVVDPRSPLAEIVRRIAASSFVTGSSLHAIVLADAYGVPARLMSSHHEAPLKYEDYYLGSGRSGYQAAPSVRRAVEMGGEPALAWDSGPLLAAFPADLWRPIDDRRQADLDGRR